jgi:hypothetical protein
MERVRAALYLDFDNVFSGLVKQDPEVALQFAEDPGGWAARLADALTVDGPRRWLILRCYMNPGGWVPHPDPEAATPRLYFSRFRTSFTKAGFEVIDCPRLTHTKNAADIRIVVDSLDALGDSTVYDEFVIASGDSDMTPLLVRLRRADRRTTIVSPFDAAEAFTSIADKLIGSEQLLELIQGEPVEESSLADVEPVDAAAVDAEEAYGRFKELVTQRFAEADVPLNLASLAFELRRLLGPAVDTTNWFGHGGFVKALESLQLPEARFSQHFLWHEGRHTPPQPAGPGSSAVTVPDPMARLSKQLGLPRLPQPIWPLIYRTLAEYAASHHFNLTEATRWSRDRLAGQGVDVSRNAIAFVTRGAAYGGQPLYRQPSPTAQAIATALVDNVFNRAEAAEIALTPDEAAVVQSWLGAPADEPA